MGIITDAVPSCKSKETTAMLSLNCKGSLLKLDKPIIMGILNITPDSFYSESRYSIDKIVDTAGLMLQQGCTILDIGGQSTNPKSPFLNVDVEMERVIPAIEAVYKALPQATLSIDTFYSNVAQEAISAGASIINDISAGSIDEHMFKTVAQLHVPYVLMHMKGTPQSMQQLTHYEDLISEVLQFFSEKILLLKSLGVHDIILDPGFGFAKTIEQNFELLSKLSIFNQLGYPVLAGLSRKSMIYKSLHISPSEALNGTTVLNTISILKGASILRVHDVAAAKEVIELLNLLPK